MGLTETKKWPENDLSYSSCGFNQNQSIISERPKE